MMRELQEHYHPTAAASRNLTKALIMMTQPSPVMSRKTELRQQERCTKDLETKQKNEQEV